MNTELPGFKFLERNGIPILIGPKVKVSSVTRYVKFDLYEKKSKYETFIYDYIYLQGASDWFYSYPVGQKIVGLHPRKSTTIL